MRIASDAAQQREIIEQIGAIERSLNATNARCKAIVEQSTREMKELNTALDRMLREAADNMAALDQRRVQDEAVFGQRREHQEDLS